MTDDAHFRLRVPQALKERIEKAAAAGNRSLNAEIVARLEETFSADGTVVGQLERQAKMLDRLTRMTQQIAAAFDEKTGQPTESGMLAAVQSELGLDRKEMLAHHEMAAKNARSRTAKRKIRFDPK